MHVFRFILLLTAFAVPFSQIVSGVHMAGHLHAPAIIPTMGSPATDLTPAEHAALHDGLQLINTVQDGPAGGSHKDTLCVIYHLVAGSHGVTASGLPLCAGRERVSHPTALQTLVCRTRVAEHNAIRGPPLFS